MTITHMVVILAFALVTSWNSVHAEELPPYLKVCSRNDPDFSSCLVRSVDALRPVLTKGDASRNIPSLEPLEVGDLLISDHSGANAVGLRIAATDIIAYGCSNFRVEKLRGDFNKLSFYFEVILPRLETSGNYAIQGNILLLPIKGSGPFSGNFTDSVGKVQMNGVIVERNGKKHVNFNDIKLKIKVGKGRFHLKNLFGGDKTLGDIINHTINANFEILSQDLIPLIDKALSKLFIKIANGIVEPFTIDQLYPDI